jgi:2-hydroxychromene-2-carboxylate isomerase
VSGAEAVPESADQPVFYYDLGSPECYLAAEQIIHVLPVMAEWQPVLATELGDAAPEVDRDELERRAHELGLQPIRWPEPLPPESRASMLAATYAKQIGRGVAFSLAAFRQAFAAGRDLGDTDTVLIAGAACEMHPAALVQAFRRRSVALALTDATTEARRAGVRSLPAIAAQGSLFDGPEALEHAAETLALTAEAHSP